MHTTARVAFVVCAVLAGGALSFATFAALTPKPVPIGEPAALAITRLETLREREPAYFLATGLRHLKAEARRDRGFAGPFPAGASIDVKGDLGLYLVRYDGTVRAFIASDPRTGCRLNVDHAGVRLAEGVLAFHDTCYGSIYDVNGTKLGGPSPWMLDELVVSVRDGLVYVDRSRVIPGRLMPSN
jgi:hypothetical protein